MKTDVSNKPIVGDSNHGVIRMIASEKPQTQQLVALTWAELTDGVHEMHARPLASPAGSQAQRDPPRELDEAQLKMRRPPHPSVGVVRSSAIIRNGIRASRGNRNRGADDEARARSELCTVYASANPSRHYAEGGMRRHMDGD
jgi:hypothetical protein